MKRKQNDSTVRKLRYYTLRNIESHDRWNSIPADIRAAIRVVGHVLPFRVNDYVLEQLIDWDAIPQDPIFQLVFPQPGMLSESDFRRVADALQRHGAADELDRVVHEVRMGLNPNPAGQMELNVPIVEGNPIPGVQHKYRETVLFFPAAGQTCHSYCTFCFRWPQFVGMPDYKFAARETEDLIAYLDEQPQVTDVLLTGGDPMVMSTDVLRRYLQPLLDDGSEMPNTIRIGSKSLAYWPARFVTDDDADDLLRFFEQIVASGRNLAFMAHFTHDTELSTPVVQEAIRRIRSTGAMIRTQSPIVRHINDSPDVWRRLWRESIRLGMMPYYMFVERDTGARDYFSVPLVRAWQVYREAAAAVSGLARTVRGPSMSTLAGKIEILGTSFVGDEQVLVLRFLQGRNPDWTYKPFFARYDEKATWINELKPAGTAERFFFQDELQALIDADRQ
ncbi:MAG: lysine 2,3-aminomutase [Spirochaetaceae bacterium]|nr:MAG: lysine 2,3-aminomutase [Spirochaetaceae bacterium]